MLRKYLKFIILETVTCIYIYCIDIYQSLSTFVHFSEFWRCSSFFVVIIYLNGSTPPPKPYKSSDSSGYCKFHTFVNENLHREVGHLRVGWGQSWCFEPHTIPIRIPDGYGNGVDPAYHFGGSLLSLWVPENPTGVRCQSPMVHDQCAKPLVTFHPTVWSIGILTGPGSYWLAAVIAYRRMNPPEIK